MSAVLSPPDERLEEMAATLLRALGPEAARGFVQRLQERKEIEEARRDPDKFIRYITAGGGGDYLEVEKYEQSPAHTDLQRFIPTGRKARNTQWLGLVCAFRGFGKTTGLKYRMLWEAGVDPNIRIKILSAAQDLPMDILATIKRQIERNPRVRNVFPTLSPGRPWSGTHLRLDGAAIDENDATFEATSVTSAGAGRRCDVLYPDDVCNAKNSVNEPNTRERMVETFEGTWLNLLEPWGRCVYSYTPWHPKDLSAYLASKAAWAKFIRPVVISMPDGTVRYTWPEKFGQEQVDALRESHDPRMFQQQYLLQPIAEEDIIFDDRTLRPSLVPVAYKSEEHMEIVKDMPKVLGVDLSSWLGEAGSYTVLMTFGISSDGRLWLIDLERGRWKAPTISALIYSKWKQFNHVNITVESNAFQSSIVDYLEATTPEAFRVPVTYHVTTGAKKHSASLGVIGMATSFGRGGFAIPVGHLSGRHFDIEKPTSVLAWSTAEVNRDPVAIYLRELVEWTIEKRAALDDTVMASWFCYYAANAGSALAAVLDSAREVR